MEYLVCAYVNSGQHEQSLMLYS